MLGEHGFRLAVSRLTYPIRLASLTTLWPDMPRRGISWLSSALQAVYSHYEKPFFGSENALAALEACLRARRSDYAYALMNCGSPYLDQVRGTGRIVGFVDGTVFKIARPPQAIQREYYNGMHKFHGLKFLGVCLPDGLLFLFGPYKGALSDYTIVHLSGICEMIDRLNVELGGKFIFYGDGGIGAMAGSDLAYTICGPLRISNNPAVNRASAEINFRMSKMRIAVEWSFGWLKTLFSALSQSTSAKLYRGRFNFRREVFFACMYLNFVFCTHRRSPASDYFHLNPPTITEYLEFYYS